MKKDFTMYVVNADGPFQLRFMNNKTNTGNRLLGSKASPDVEEICKWNLSKDEAEDLIKDIKDVLKEAVKCPSS